MNQKLIRELVSYREELLKDSKLCHFNLRYSCCEQAINSHILQKRGIIDRLSTNGRVVKSYFDYFTNRIKFRGFGINEVLSFTCFCKFHDEIIFSPIEKISVEELDFNDYRIQLLFSYRALLHEAHKKEIAGKQFDFTKRFVNESKHDIIESLQLGYTFGILEINEFYIKGIESDLIGENKDNYIFKTKVIKKHLPVCNSTFISLTPTSNELSFEVDNSVIFSIIPREFDTMLIFGVHRNFSNKPETVKLFNFLENDNDSDLLSFISGILLYNCEDWIMSYNFYNCNIKPKIDYYSKLISDSIDKFGLNYSNSINLFA